VGLGEHGKESLDSIKCGKFPGKPEGLQTVTSNLYFQYNQQDATLYNILYYR
jgi:hypothetical protein